jgi:myosin-crossreactive antigen
MPYVNNVWLPWSRGDMPPPVPEGSINLGLIGQYDPKALFDALKVFLSSPL